MSDYPPITIVMTTWFASHWAELRTKVVYQTIDSWRRFFEYAGELRLHVADDGSEYDFMPERVWYKEITKSQQSRRGVGASLNAGFKEAFKVSPLVIYAADDWQLTQVFDLSPWARLLLTDESLGVVRLSPPHPNIKGSVMHLGALGWALRLERYAFAFGHRPALYHQRLIKHYGWFDEDQSALETERLYSVRVNETAGPDIILALPSAFEHLSSVELAYVNPVNKEDYGYFYEW